MFLPNGNPGPVDVELTWSFSGGVLDRDLSRTIPAGASSHELTFETTTEIARLAPGQTVDVTAEVTNANVGIALSGSCGQLFVTGGFDEDKVFVPADECTISPQQVTPPQEVSLSATVVNDNLFSAIAEVWWIWQGHRIASIEVAVYAESQTTAQATATIEREGRDQVRSRVERASGGLIRPTGFGAWIFDPPQ